jgi:hypothetical protein
MMIHHHFCLQQKATYLQSSTWHQIMKEGEEGSCIQHVNFSRQLELVLRYNRMNPATNSNYCRVVYFLLLRTVLFLF